MSRATAAVPGPDGDHAELVERERLASGRLESGRYGGLTVERFIAVLDAFDALGRGRRSA